MNKKAYVFTVLAFVVVGVVSATYLLSSVQSSRMQSNTQHIYAANQFIEQFEDDLSRALSIISYRGLLGVNEHVSVTGSFVDDFDEVFASIVRNGSVNTTFYDVMQDSTLESFQQRMQSISSQVGLNFSLHISNVTLTHTSPYNVQVAADVQYVLRTRDVGTSFNRSQQITSTFSIVELLDPLYTVYSSGRVFHPVQQVSTQRPFITASNDSSRLTEVLESTQYVTSANAPTFLMRFENNLSAHPYGIVSLVDVRELDTQGVPVNPTASAVDYEYFSQSPPIGSQIVNMTSTFRLDTNHLALFDAEGKTI